MYLKHLSLTNYRAFARLDLDVPKGTLLIVGGNAQGKTSLLESVFFLATFTSFQASQDRQLISFLAQDESLAVCRIVADIERGGNSTRIEARLILEKNQNGNARFRKEILVDGVKKSIQEALGYFTAVIFLPQMTRIIEDGPEERRKFLNLVLSQAVPGYAATLSEYAQVVSQRNALLKLIHERSTDLQQLDFWDEMLAERGAVLIHARRHAIKAIEGFATRIHHQLTNTREILRLEYQPAYNPFVQSGDQYRLPMQAEAEQSDISQDEIQSGFVKQLRAIRSDEIARGVTTIGPHRDEMRVLSNGVDLGVYGSRGQIRTALLSLKMAEVNWLYEKTGQWPVLLLDEIMAELDAQRRTDLMSYIQQFEQVFVSTTDLDTFSTEFVTGNTVWRVQQGIIRLPENTGL
jgi:DNA replication and repair protein RecF